MKILATICALFLFFSGSVIAADLRNQAYADAAYLEMVRQARLMPKNFDFIALRKAYTLSSYYSPEGDAAYKVDLFKAFDKVRAGKPEGARELEALLNHHFAHYALHLYLRDANEKHNPIRVHGIDPTLHTWALNGIMPSILCNQAGLIPERAIRVLDVGEEFFVAQWHFKAEVNSHQRVKIDERDYDVLFLNRNGHTARVHFNIDIPLSYRGAQTLTQR